MLNFFKRWIDCQGCKIFHPELLPQLHLRWFHASEDSRSIYRWINVFSGFINLSFDEIGFIWPLYANLMHSKPNLKFLNSKINAKVQRKIISRAIECDIILRSTFAFIFKFENLKFGLECIKLAYRGHMNPILSKERLIKPLKTFIYRYIDRESSEAWNHLKYTTLKP